MGLIMREAGKTLSNAVAEVREAVDFLRYYGAQAAAHFDNAAQRPLGVVLAISPRSEEHTSELQSPCNLVCRLLLEKKNTTHQTFPRLRGAVRSYSLLALCHLFLPAPCPWNSPRPPPRSRSTGSSTANALIPRGYRL